VTAKLADSRNNTEQTLLEGFIHYASILLKYKWMIVIITVLTTVAVAALLFITIILPPEKSPLPNKYRSQAVLLVQEEQGGGGLGAIVASMGLSIPGRSASMDYGEIALMVLQSKIILDPLVEEFDIVRKYKIEKSIRTASRQALLDRTEVNYQGSTGALTISFEDTDPVLARDMVNRMVELLDEWFLLRGGTRKLKEKELLEKKLQEISIEISRLEAQVQDFQKKHGLITVEELAESQATLLADLRSQLVLQELEIKNYSLFSKIEDPELIRMKAARDNIIELIEQNEIAFTQLDLPTLSLEFARLTTALDIQRRIYVSISEQYEISKLSLETEPVFQILETAEIPDVTSSPRRIRLWLATVLIAFTGSIMLAFFLNGNKKYKTDPGGKKAREK
jgi:tyrosine-protein kinase Etk/Wzc